MMPNSDEEDSIDSNSNNEKYGVVFKKKQKTDTYLPSKG
jgi:hypothetical protein